MDRSRPANIWGRSFEIATKIPGTTISPSHVRFQSPSIPHSGAQKSLSNYWLSKGWPVNTSRWSSLSLNISGKAINITHHIFVYFNIHLTHINTFDLTVWHLNWSDSWTDPHCLHCLQYERSWGSKYYTSLIQKQFILCYLVTSVMEYCEDQGGPTILGILLLDRGSQKISPYNGETNLDIFRPSPRIYCAVKSQKSKRKI